MLDLQKALKLLTLRVWSRNVGYLLLYSFCSYISIALLDTNDPNLQFVVAVESVRPMSIFRIGDGEFLICYFGELSHQDYIF